MTRWLIGALVAFGVALGATWLWGSAGYRKADEAAGAVKVLEAQREALEALARRDSVSLDSIRTVAGVRVAVLEAGRVQARQGAARASQDATEARGEVRAVLDSLGASHEALDRLEAAHAAEIASKDTEIQQADSTTAVVRGLLVVTEAALASERAAHQGTSRENEALRDQIQALNRGRWKGRATTVGLVVVVIAVAVLR